MNLKKEGWIAILLGAGISLAAMGISLPHPAWATDYEVGAGKTYANLEALRTAPPIAFAAGDRIILSDTADSSLQGTLVIPGFVAVVGANTVVTPAPNVPGDRLIKGSIGTPSMSGITFGSNDPSNKFSGATEFAGTQSVTPTLNNVNFVGNARSSSSSDGEGGGAAFTNTAAMNLTNASFTGNTAVTSSAAANDNAKGGGAFFDTIGNLNLSNVTADGNTAKNTGGGEAAGGGAAFIGTGVEVLAIQGSTFSNNKVVASPTTWGEDAVWGGGASIDDVESVQLKDSKFSGNSVAASGKGLAVGGGLSLYNDDGSSAAASLTDVTFTGNSVSSVANEAHGGGAAFTNISTVNLTNVTFSGNTAVTSSADDTADAFGGGAAFDTVSNLNLSNVTFEGNTAQNTGAGEASGGGLSTWGGVTIMVQDSTFTNNKVISNPTTLGEDASWGGGAAFEATTNITIKNSTFSNNSVTASGSGVAFGGGLTIDDEDVTTSSTANLINVQVTGNSVNGARLAFGGGMEYDSSAPSATLNIIAENGKTSLWQGNTANGVANGMHLFSNTGQVDVNLDAQGTGAIYLYDPITAAGVGSLTISKIGTGDLYWYGVNDLNNAVGLERDYYRGGYIGNGSRSVRFMEGTTYIGPDFTLKSSTGNQALNVTLGAGHKMYFTGNRAETLPVFDYKGTSGSTFTAETGTTLGLRTLDAVRNVLLVDGLNVSGVAPGMFTIESAFSNASFSTANNQLVVDFGYAPLQTPNLSPNVIAAAPAFNQLLATPAGQALTGEQYATLLHNVSSITPEMVLSSAQAGVSTANSVAANALSHGLNTSTSYSGASQSFSSMLSTGSQTNSILNSYGKRALPNDRDSFNLGLAANTEQALYRQSIIAGFQPADEKSRMAFDGVPTAGAESSPLVHPLRLWSSYVGDFMRLDRHNGFSGYNADTNGFLIGLSYNFTQEFLLGVYSGYSKTDTRFKGMNADTDTDAWHMGIYGSYTAAKTRPLYGLTVEGDVNYSQMDNSSHRSIGIESFHASYDQNVLGFGLKGSFDIAAPAGWDQYHLSPYLGIRYTHMKQDGYNEGSAFGASRVGSSDGDNFNTNLGIVAAYDFIFDNAVLTPKLRVGWVHEYGDKQFSSTAAYTGVDATYLLKSAPLDRDALQLGGHIETLIKTRSVDIGLKAGYDADVRSNSVNHAIYGGVEFRF